MIATHQSMMTRGDPMMAKFFAASALSLAACSVGAVSLTYDDLNEKPILENQSGFLVGQVFDITNNSGQTWNDFHLSLDVYEDPDGFLGAGGPTFFIDTASAGFDGTAYDGPGSYSLSNNQTVIDILNLSIPDGDTYTFTVDVAQGETTNHYDILGKPTVANEVPEPGTLGLMLLGVGGLVARFSKQASR